MPSLGYHREPPQRNLGAASARLLPSIAALLVITLSECTTGCAIIGGGVGSLIPKYEPLPQEPVAEQASSGQKIRIVRQSDGRELFGRYDGVYDEKLWIHTKSGSSSVDTRDVKSARIVADNHWFEGFLVGLAVDVTVIAIVGADIRHVFPQEDSQYHVGADGVNVAAH